MTAFAAIVAAVKSRLTTPTAVAEIVDKGLRRPVPDSAFTAVQIRLDRADGERFGILGGPVDWTTSLILECYARDRVGADADTAADALMGAVAARLMADPTLGGLVGDIAIAGLEYDYDAAGDKTACIALTCAVLHRTSNQTLE